MTQLKTNGRPRTDGLYPTFLMGLVSFGSKECGIGYPGIYTRISDMMPWIKKNLK